VKVQGATERRTDSINKLHTLIETRTETLALLQQLAAMRPFDGGEAMQTLLQEFCESLVDYTASAHFQLYQFIEDGTERRAAVLEVAALVYPRISEITRQILEFNDKYDSETGLSPIDELDQDLSRLAEVIADRITEEDKIIEAFNRER
jgi:regulator of sigma D